MELPPEKRFDMVVPFLFDSIGSIVKAVDKKFGAEGRDTLRQVKTQKGYEMGKQMKPMCPGEDFKSVGTFFVGIVKVFGVENELEVKEDGVVVKVQKCPYGLEGTSRELCEALMAFDMKFIETLGPNVAMEIVKTVAVGDPRCELSIKPKK